MKEPKTAAKAVAGLVADLPEEELILLADTALRPRLRRWLGRAARRQGANTFATPLGDNDIPEHLQNRVAAWRKLAAELGYSGPIAWHVRAGFTLKAHGPKAGPCYEGWQYLQSWDLQNDVPTVASIVFWIPRLVTDSTRKNVEEQQTLLAEVRTRLELPAHHLKDFGSASLLTALIQAHAKRTGERTPLNGYWTRSDTLHVDGYRLFLHWHEGEFYCGDWDGGARYDDLGAFPLGVEALGS